jgi:hypothetical protein
MWHHISAALLLGLKLPPHPVMLQCRPCVANPVLPALPKARRAGSAAEPDNIGSNVCCSCLRLLPVCLQPLREQRASLGRHRLQLNVSDQAISNPTHSTPHSSALLTDGCHVACAAVMPVSFKPRLLMPRQGACHAKALVACTL